MQALANSTKLNLAETNANLTTRLAKAESDAAKYKKKVRKLLLRNEKLEVKAAKRKQSDRSG